MRHIPVLLNEIINYLAPRAGECFVDGTVNRGGHALEIGKRLGKDGRLIGIDQDKTALAEAKENLKILECEVALLEGNFRNVDTLLAARGIEKVDGVLFDLGLSSNQLEQSGRGFTFQKDEPLLMTFSADPMEDQITAADIVNSWDQENIETIVRAYGEESFAGRIARHICEARKENEIRSTSQLVEIIRQAVPFWYTKKKVHFATKTFQALRIAVNDELGAVNQGMIRAWECLVVGGRMGIISFHSLEARAVKEFYKKKVAEGVGELITKKAIKPTRQEEVENPRSRSAQFRVIKKLSN